MHGSSIQRAMALAGTRVLTSKDYAVTGDGTDSLVAAPGEPAVIYLEDVGLSYDVTVERITVGLNGPNGVARVGNRILGTATERTLPADQPRPFLQSASLTVIYNGRFHWSSDRVTSI